MWERKAKKEKSENRDLQENRQDMVLFFFFSSFTMDLYSQLGLKYPECYFFPPTK